MVNRCKEEEDMEGWKISPIQNGSDCTFEVKIILKVIHVLPHFGQRLYEEETFLINNRKFWSQFPNFWRNYWFILKGLFGKRIYGIIFLTWQCFYQIPNKCNNFTLCMCDVEKFHIFWIERLYLKRKRNKIKSTFVNFMELVVVTI
jgi:hypothetical protein